MSEREVKKCDLSVNPKGNKGKDYSPLEPNQIRTMTTFEKKLSRLRENSVRKRQKLRCSTNQAIAPGFQILVEITYFFLPSGASVCDSHGIV